MTAHDALSRYREIQEVTRHMLAAAQTGDWEALVNLEAGRKAALAAVTDPSIDYQAAGLASDRDGCILSILDMDQQIRALTEAWMGEMREILGNVRSQRRLEQAYSMG